MPSDEQTFFSGGSGGSLGRCDPYLEKCRLKSAPAPKGPIRGDGAMEPDRPIDPGPPQTGRSDVDAVDTGVSTTSPQEPTEPQEEKNLIAADEIRRALVQALAGDPPADAILDQYDARVQVSLPAQYPGITPAAAAWQAAWELRVQYGLDVVQLPQPPPQYDPPPAHDPIPFPNPNPQERT